MQTAAHIVRGTPIWAWAILAYLVYQGVQSLQARTMAVSRALIVPILFICLGLSRIVLSHEAGIAAIGAWVVGALIAAPWPFVRGVRLVAVDPRAGTITRPGGWTPLARNVCVFLLQYGVAVATAMKLAQGGPAAALAHFVSGATAGYFLGWTIVLIREYRAAKPV
jgi:hypothetical protein